MAYFIDESICQPNAQLENVINASTNNFSKCWITNTYYWVIKVRHQSAKIKSFVITIALVLALVWCVNLSTRCTAMHRKERDLIAGIDRPKESQIQRTISNVTDGKSWCEGKICLMSSLWRNCTKKHIRVIMDVLMKIYSFLWNSPERVPYATTGKTISSRKEPPFQASILELHGNEKSQGNFWVYRFAKQRKSATVEATAKPRLVDN